MRYVKHEKLIYTFYKLFTVFLFYFLFQQEKTKYK
jgi:hypothetical protein